MEVLFVILASAFIGVWVWLVLKALESFWNSLVGLYEAIFGKEEETPPSRSYSSSSWVWTSPKPERENPYTRDWSSVSKKYKESRGWRCENCYVNLSSKHHRRLLHVHHRDNDPQNNSSWNLVALCVVCHSEQPGAGHKRLAGAIRRDGRKQEVENLRW